MITTEWTAGSYPSYPIGTDSSGFISLSLETEESHPVELEL